MIAYPLFKRKKEYYSNLQDNKITTWQVDIATSGGLYMMTVYQITATPGHLKKAPVGFPWVLPIHKVRQVRQLQHTPSNHWVTRSAVVSIPLVSPTNVSNRRLLRHGTRKIPGFSGDPVNSTKMVWSKLRLERQKWPMLDSWSASKISIDYREI